MGSPIALASLALVMGSPGVAALASLAAGAASPNGTLLWRSAVGCHHWGPGCWVPNFSGTDASPAVSPRGATVVVGSYDGTVYALDGADGSFRWNASLDMGVGEGTPALVGRGCYVVCGLFDVRCLDGESGAATWTFAPGGQIGACGGYDGARVFVGTLRKELVAIDAADGAELWRYEGQGEVWATHGPRVVGDLVCSGFGGAAYVKENCSATVDCVNRSTGALAWRAPAGLQVQSTPAVGASQLYVGSYDNCLYAYALAGGDVRWRTCTAGRLEASALVMERHGAEVVVVGSGDGHVYAFSAAGDVLWRTRLGAAVSLLRQGGVGSSAALRGDTLYVGGPDAFFALDADSGAERWRRTTGAMVGSSPAVFGTRVYVGCEDGYLYAFDVEDDP